MKQEGVDPNSVTFVGVLKACATVLALEEGRCVHQEVIQSGLELDVFVGSSLVDMYAKCGSMDDAWRVFNKMPFRNVVTWSTILGGCAMHGHGSREYGHGNALETACGSMGGFAWRLQNSWHLCENVYRQRMARGVKRQPGCTWIEVNNEKKRHFICVTIVRNWPLHLGSSTQLLVVLSE
ncbi:unnamed protein product [Sphagnum compactum]